MIKFSDPIDQQRYDAGFKFMPQDRFLAGPFNPNSIGLPSLGVSGAMPTGNFGIARLNPNINVGPNVPITGEEDDEFNIDRTDNFGINSFADLMQSGFFNSPANIGFNTFGLPGAILGTIGSQAYDNFQNQYTDILGRLNKQTKQAILEDYRDSEEGQQSAQDYADLQAEIGQTRDAPGGNGGNNSGGDLDSGGREGYGGGGQYG